MSLSTHSLFTIKTATKILLLQQDWKNRILPQFVKGGSSIVLSVGRSAIFCSPSFPHNNRHLTHFPIKLLTIVLHRTTQNPLLLISLMVSPLPP